MNGVYWVFANSSVQQASAPPEPMPPEPMPPQPRQLAIVLCPHGGRYLHAELLHLRTAGIDALVSLLSDEQVELLDLSDEPFEAMRLGMQFLHHPIPDHQLPTDPLVFRAFVGNLAHRLRAGQRIGIHCWGSIGRATLAAACTLIHLGWEPREALTAVEAARGCTVPDTEEQERWILNYKAQP